MIDRNPHVKVRTEEGGRPLNNTAALSGVVWVKFLGVQK
jgi:hypothetical protein